MGHQHIPVEEKFREFPLNGGSFQEGVRKFPDPDAFLQGFQPQGLLLKGKFLPGNGQVKRRSFPAQIVPAVIPGAFKKAGNLAGMPGDLHQELCHASVHTRSAQESSRLRSLGRFSAMT